MKTIKFLIVLALIFGTESNAYNYPVHFYTTSLVAQKLGLDHSNKEWQLLSLCTHLPDESGELTAINARLRLGFINHISWGIFSKRNSEATRRMITIQQLLHGLTGGEAQEMQEAVEEIVSELWSSVTRTGNDNSEIASPTERAEKICALGFGLHLLGDSFAHRRLNSNKDRMYATGLGHAGDGTQPDALLRDTNSPEYGIEYWREHITIIMRISNSGDLDADLMQIYEKIESIEKGDGIKMRKKARTIIKDAMDSSTIAKGLNFHARSPKPCQTHLNSLCKTGFGANGLPLSCKNIWEYFKSVAAPVFIKRGESLRSYADVGVAPREFESPKFDDDVYCQ